MVFYGDNVRSHDRSFLSPLKSYFPNIEKIDEVNNSTDTFWYQSIEAEYAFK